MAFVFNYTKYVNKSDLFFDRSNNFTKKIGMSTTLLKKNIIQSTNLNFVMLLVYNLHILKPKLYIYNLQFVALSVQFTTEILAKYTISF